MPSGAVCRLSGILLTGSFVLSLGGVLLFNGHTTFRWFDETPTTLRWERGLFITAYVVAALGVALLELHLREAGAAAAVLARLGATAFLMGAVCALVAEAAIVSAQGLMVTEALVVVMVVLLFVAEAILGAALRTSGLVPAGMAWTTVAWNSGWLLVLPLVSPGDIYYPALHFVPLLLIGIPLARRAGRVGKRRG